jgi:hypothetical protein
MISRLFLGTALRKKAVGFILPSGLVQAERYIET